MENLLKEVLEKKGLLIGMGAGILRVIQCIHNGHFKPFKALLNIVSCSIMGYFTWEVGYLLEINITIIIVATVVSSFTPFVTIEILTDKKLLMKILSNWFDRKEINIIHKKEE